jgi:hypothetical protein
VKKVDFDCKMMIRTSLRLYQVLKAEINSAVSHFYMFQASRLMRPVLINKNLSALGCPVIFTPNSIAINYKSTIAVAKEEEKPSVFMRVAKKFYDVSKSVSTTKFWFL